MNDVYIVKAKRTAIGSFLGSLSAISAPMLSARLIEHITLDIDKNIIDEVILGHVLQGGVGQNSARQSVINARLGNDIIATTINKVCGSGLKSVIFGHDSILAKRNDIVIAGGHENMSLTMHGAYLRTGLKYGNISQVDLIMRDGLSDAFSNLMMGVTAENIATKYNITRVQQDEFSYESQKKAKIARDMGYFDSEILSVETKTGGFLRDEFIKDNSTLEALSKLKPVFDPKGSVTAGNSSGINDGAAILMLASEGAVSKYNLPILAKIVSTAAAGVEPDFMGTGPIPAVKKAIAKAGWHMQDLDLIESNEAFAAQSICVANELEMPLAKVNICGGAIALGHPIGASGARILVTLIHQMQRLNMRKGLATLCVGGGMGVSICIER